MERIFISSAMKGRGPFGLTWEALREEVRRVFEEQGIPALALEGVAPEPRPPWVVFTQLADECTSYLGLWSEHFSPGTVEEFIRCGQKPCYILLLGCSIAQAFQRGRKELPTGATLGAVRQAISSRTHSCYPIRSRALMRRCLKGIANTLLLRDRWARVGTFDPDTFVGREEEMGTCREAVGLIAKRARLVVLRGPSSSGKTTFLRALGYDLCRYHTGRGARSRVVFLDGAAPSGEFLSSLFVQLGDSSAGRSVMAASTLSASGEESAAVQWEHFLARKVSSEQREKLHGMLLGLINAHNSPSVVLIDDIQGISDDLIARLVRFLASAPAARLSVICAWRSEIPSVLGGQLVDGAAKLGGECYNAITLSSLADARTSIAFLERRLRHRLESAGSEVERSVAELLPGDLTELARFLSQQQDHALTVQVLRFFSKRLSNGVNKVRWSRLHRLRSDLRVLAAAGTGAPADIIRRAARAAGMPIRFSRLVAAGAALEVVRATGEVWYKAFPERFGEFVWSNEVSRSLRVRLISAMLAAILRSHGNNGGNPDTLYLAQRLSLNLNPCLRASWLKQLGRLALAAGWLRCAVALLNPLTAGRVAALGGARDGDLFLELVDVHRQLGDREAAVSLVRRLVQ